MGSIPGRGTKILYGEAKKKKKTTVGELTLLFKNIYLFIWLHQVFIASHGIFSCGSRTLYL